MTPEQQRVSRNANIRIILACVCFALLGTLRSFTAFPNNLTAVLRALFGIITFYLFLRIKNGEKLDFKAIKANLPLLALSGFTIAVCWFTVFEGFTYLSNALTIVIVYIGPAIVVLVSPIVLKERISTRKLLCVFSSIFGVVFLSGILNGGLQTGTMYGFFSAVVCGLSYAGTTLCNKKLPKMRDIDKATAQFFFTFLFLLPTLFLVDFSTFVFTWKDLGISFLIGLVCASGAYGLYFSVMDYLSAQTIALLSYLDPLLSIVFALMFLGESLTLNLVIGVVLILGSSIIGEIEYFPGGKKYAKRK